jgi:hypothetical protein
VLRRVSDQQAAVLLAVGGIFEQKKNNQIKLLLSL